MKKSTIFVSFLLFFSLMCLSQEEDWRQVFSALAPVVEAQNLNEKTVTTLMGAMFSIRKKIASAKNMQKKISQREKLFSEQLKQPARDLTYLPDVPILAFSIDSALTVDGSSISTEAQSSSSAQTTSSSSNSVAFSLASSLSGSSLSQALSSASPPSSISSGRDMLLGKRARESGGTEQKEKKRQRTICLYCHKFYVHEKNLSKHEKTCKDNPNRIVFKCNECGTEFNWKSKLEWHKKRHENK